jgi:hypothetical protein
LAKPEGHAVRVPFVLATSSVKYSMITTTRANTCLHGTIIYAVASDHKEYWLTITSLRNPGGGPVTLEHVAGLFELEPIWVMRRKHHNPGEGYQPFLE